MTPRFLTVRDLQDWNTKVNPQLKKDIIAFLKMFDAPISPFISAVIKDTPTHRKGNSVDVALRLADRAHPVTRSQSLRLTDKRLLHAKLKDNWNRTPLSAAIVIENDHFHVTTSVPPGIWVFDNPRMTYQGESDLLSNPRLRDLYDGPLQELIRIHPGPRKILSVTEVQTIFRNEDE